MLYSKFIPILIALCFCGRSYAQGYFHSIGERRETVAVPDTIMDEVDEQFIDSVGTLPFDSESVKNIWTVSMPLDNLHMTSPFGIRRDPLNKRTRRMHSGIDLRARYEPVRSMLPGTVIESGYSKTGGYYVSVSHGVCICSYLHLSKIKVCDGSHVSAGEVIAISGASGSRVTGPHLHLSARYVNGNSKGKYFNPLLLLEFVAARLNENKLVK